MKLHDLVVEQSGTNTIISKSLEMIEKDLKKGDSRLAKPLSKGEIAMSDLISCIKKQSCLRITNYIPDSSNEHLPRISVGPSYLEQQFSRSINKMVKKNFIPSQWVKTINKLVGLQ